MLGRFSRLQLKNVLGTPGVCLLLGLAASLAPHDAIGQETAPSAAPTTDSAPAEHHRAGASIHAHTTADTATADNGIPHDRPAGPHADRNHAEEQQQALHAEIQKKFKEFNAAFKKTTLAMTARAHRPPQTGAKVDHTQDQPPSPTASAATQKPSGNPQMEVHRHPVPVTLPAPVRGASVSAPTNPHGPKPMLTTLGGLAPYDPKKGAVLSGNTMNRRL